MSMKITQTHVDIVFYDVFGNVLHKWGISEDHDNAELWREIYASSTMDKKIYL